MSGALYNLAAMTVASTGTGTITLGSAAKINGVQYLSFASAGVPDGQPVYYSINDPGGSGASEVGIGTYTSSGTTLTRSVITSTNANAAINMSASAIVRISPPTSQFREVLTANRTYYVRTDGSDSNTGLANTAGSAFLTIQKAVDLISSTLDIASYVVTVQIADGTYTGAVNLKNVVGFGAAGNLVIRGNNTTPANVVISVTSGTCFTADGISSVWDILDLKMQTTTSGNCIRALAGAKIRWGNTDFGTCAEIHLQAFGPGSTLTSVSNYAITGGASTHFQAYYGGVIITPSRTITITGTFSISIFADMRVLGSGQLFSITFAGTYTVTGTRYRSQENSVCFVNGAGATYFPGSIAGSTSTGGLYV